MLRHDERKRETHGLPLLASHRDRLLADVARTIELAEHDSSRIHRLRPIIPGVEAERIDVGLMPRRFVGVRTAAQHGGRVAGLPEKLECRRQAFASRPR
jgi:hypothetical protein